MDDASSIIPHINKELVPSFVLIGLDDVCNCVCPGLLPILKVLTWRYPTFSDAKDLYLISVVVVSPMAVYVAAFFREEELLSACVLFSASLHFFTSAKFTTC